MYVHLTISPGACFSAGKNFRFWHSSVSRSEFFARMLKPLTAALFSTATVSQLGVQWQISFFLYIWISFTSL